MKCSLRPAEVVFHRVSNIYMFIVNWKWKTVGVRVRRASVFFLFFFGGGERE